MQTMGRVGTCPHLIRHQYAWRFFCWLWARVWWFYLFACGTNGGSKPPPYTIYRLILWSDGRPPKMLSLFNAGNSFFAHGFCGLRDWRTLFSLQIARLFWREVCFAFIVWSAFWFCALVIEGAALKLPQACCDKSLICRLRALDRALFLAHCFVVLSWLCWAAWFAKTACFRSCQ